MCEDAGTVADALRITAALSDVQAAYQTLKARLLAAGAQDELPVAVMDGELRAASARHRALQQQAKASGKLAEVQAEGTRRERT